MTEATVDREQAVDTFKGLDQPEVTIDAVRRALLMCADYMDLPDGDSTNLFDLLERHELLTAPGLVGIVLCCGELASGLFADGAAIRAFAAQPNITLPRGDKASPEAPGEDAEGESAGAHDTPSVSAGAVPPSTPVAEPAPAGAPADTPMPTGVGRPRRRLLMDALTGDCVGDATDEQAEASDAAYRDSGDGTIHIDPEGHVLTEDAPRPPGGTRVVYVV